MSAFRSRRKGRVHVTMPALNARLLADLAGQLVELLSEGEPTAMSSGDVGDPLEQLAEIVRDRDTPDDPALQRLLPDAYRDDPELAGEFRRFTEADLRASKIAAARLVIDTIGDVGVEEDQPDVDFELGPEETRSWMRCLTDLRLTLASRLDITGGEDDDAMLDLPEDDPVGSLYRIYGWLGYQLELLVEAAQR